MSNTNPSDYLFRDNYTGSGRNNILKRIKEVLTSSNLNQSVAHYANDKNHIPAWILVTAMPLGLAIKWYTILKSTDKQSICEQFIESNSLSVEEKKEFILRNEVDWIKDKYDFIIIDCPPSLNLLTINSMTTADSVLVPIQCEYYALEGLSQLIHTVNLVKERLNPDLDMEGVVFTMYDSRTNLSMQVVENVKNHFKQNVYNTVIPRNIRLAEAPSYGMPISMYDPKSAGAEAYMLLADEVINRKGV